MIESLTPEQESMMEVYREKWIDIGLSTAPLNKERAIAAVKLMYERGGIEVPDTILFAKGPLDCLEVVNQFARENGEEEVSLSDLLASFVCGSHEAFWISFYDYFKEVVEVENLEIIDGVSDVSKECGWVACFDKLAVICEKPLIIKMNENNLLHCENGPAIKYSDGFEVYSWNGTRVPKKFIMKEITATDALTEENLELRRCACEILGWEAILQELDPIVINRDDDPQIGELVEVEIPDIGREKYLRVQCGTGRMFALPVPPDMKTALQANAWTYGLEESEYKPEIRT
jgi:hypothetical protein